VRRFNARLLYEIELEGQLDSSRWSRWFEGMDVALTGHGGTIISGRVDDQAALHGLLAKVRDLGLPLVSLRRLDGRADNPTSQRRPI
jgi:hypothetical protein